MTTKLPTPPDAVISISPRIVLDPPILSVGKQYPPVCPRLRVISLHFENFDALSADLLKEHSVDSPPPGILDFSSSELPKSNELQSYLLF